MTLKRAGWLAILISLVVMIGSAAMVMVHVGPAFSDALNDASYPTPMNQTLKLDAGDYLIYQSTGGQLVDSSEVKVIAPSGDPVALVLPGVQQTLERSEATFTARLGFTAPTSGDYKVSVLAPEGSSMLVTRNLVNQVTDVAGWFGGGFLGFLLLIAGVVMVLVARSRRRATEASAGQYGQAPLHPNPAWPAYSSTTPPPSTQPQDAPPRALPQAGWYPDPQDRQRWRWWDGTSWGPSQGESGGGVNLTK